MIRLTKLLKVPTYIRATIKLKSEDIILASFPKSGNTWVRNIICNYISIEEMNGKTIDFKTLDEIMPGFVSSSYFNQWAYKIPKFIASHLRYGIYFTKPKKILLIRDPRDVMVSYYHFLNNKKHLPNFNSLSDLMQSKKYGIRSWIKHYKSWVSKADYILTYEDMLKNDVIEIENLFNFLNIKYDKANLEAAVEKSRFKNFKKIEEKFGHSKTDQNLSTFTFVRKGIAGDYRNHFRNEDYEYYNKMMKLYKVDIYND